MDRPEIQEKVVQSACQFVKIMNDDAKSMSSQLGHNNFEFVPIGTRNGERPNYANTLRLPFILKNNKYMFKHELFEQL